MCANYKYLVLFLLECKMKLYIGCLCPSLHNPQFLGLDAYCVSVIIRESLTFTLQLEGLEARWKVDVHCHPVATLLPGLVWTGVENFAPTWI
jgi:hypothetical protein